MMPQPAEAGSRTGAMLGASTRPRAFNEPLDSRSSSRDLVSSKPALWRSPARPQSSWLPQHARVAGGAPHRVAPHSS
jgi:hypothetical protein